MNVLPSVPVTRRIAMWSGPRNISTALLRAWENRADTTVVDEPLYAAYLAETGLDHPGASKIIAHGETDWRRVAEWLTGPVPGGKQIWYQKLMTHHMLPQFDRGWIDNLTNCFLIRSPREVITSYIKVRPTPTAADLGFHQQIELFQSVHRVSGSVPPVLDARDVLQDPGRLLALLCAAIHLPFDEAMLAWPAGPRDSDGTWAPYWYAAVEQSTSFQPYVPKEEQVPAALEPLWRECETIYQEMAQYRLGQ